MQKSEEAEKSTEQEEPPSLDDSGVSIDDNHAEEENVSKPKPKLKKSVRWRERLEETSGAVLQCP